jgi:hypothetical protein
MARSATHTSGGGYIYHEHGRFHLPKREGCEGFVRLLYSRRSKPQRWLVVGAYCDGCGDSTVQTERQVERALRAV